MLHLITGNYWAYIPGDLRGRSVLEKIAADEVKELVPDGTPFMTADTLRGLVNENSVIITVNEGIVSKHTFTKVTTPEAAVYLPPIGADFDDWAW